MDCSAIVDAAREMAEAAKALDLKAEEPWQCFAALQDVKALEKGVAGLRDALASWAAVVPEPWLEDGLMESVKSVAASLREIQLYAGRLEAGAGVRR